MAVTTLQTWSSAQIPPFPVRRFTVAEYHQMIEAGILTENDPVELLEGWIVPKMPRNPHHDGTIELIQERLRTILPAGWKIRGQSAITTSDSEPEPDLAIARGTVRSHLIQHPGPQEIALVIEVADSSLTHDRIAKGSLYARAGLPLYWIINLVDSQLEVYTEPSGPGPTPGYRQRQDFGVHESVPVILEGREIAQVAVRDLLP